MPAKTMRRPNPAPAIDREKQSAYSHLGGNGAQFLVRYAISRTRHFRELAGANDNPVDHIRNGDDRRGDMPLAFYEACQTFALPDQETSPHGLHNCKSGNGISVPLCICLLISMRSRLSKCSLRRRRTSSHKSTIATNGCSEAPCTKGGAVAQGAGRFGQYAALIGVHLFVHARVPAGRPTAHLNFLCRYAGSRAWFLQI